MGSDDLFKKKKRQPIKDGDQKRRRGLREQREKVLIVTEGETEANYFNELCQAARLSATQAQPACAASDDGTKVTPSEDGSAPRSVLRCAERLYDASEEGGDPYDHVYCVIDRDSHSDFDETLSRIDDLSRQKRKAKPFAAIVSYPCFEYWLLLHFTYTRKPFARSGKKSPCDLVVGELKKGHIPSYCKNQESQKGLYGRLASMRKTAMERAERAAEEAKGDGERNPSTDIHVLIEKLLGDEKTPAGVGQTSGKRQPKGR